MKTIGENEEKVLEINLYGQAKDEIELIVLSITKLIEHIDLSTCVEDPVRFVEEMNKITAIIEKNYITNNISLPGIPNS